MQTVPQENITIADPSVSGHHTAMATVILPYVRYQLAANWPGLGAVRSAPNPNAFACALQPSVKAGVDRRWTGARKDSTWQLCIHCVSMYGVHYARVGSISNVYLFSAGGALWSAGQMQCNVRIIEAAQPRLR